MSTDLTSPTDLTPPTPPSPRHTPGPLALPAPLSGHDTSILSLLFSSGEPEFPSSDTPSTSPQNQNNITLDPTLPYHPAGIPAHLLPGIKQRELNAIVEAERALQLQSPSTTPESTPSTTTSTTESPQPSLTHALTTLTNLITAHPTYPSAYNNRAQLLRLLLPPNTPLDPSSPTAIQIQADLTTALSLALPSPPLATTITVPTAQALIIQQSYTQLGALYLLYAKSLSPVSPSHSPSLSPSACSAGGLEGEANTAQATHYSDKAASAFANAGRWGGEVGRKMAVVTNPVGRLCGGIVREVLRREMLGGMEGGE